MRMALRIASAPVFSRFLLLQVHVFIFPYERHSQALYTQINLQTNKQGSLIDKMKLPWPHQDLSMAPSFFFDPFDIASRAAAIVIS